MRFRHRIPWRSRRLLRLALLPGALISVTSSIATVFTLTSHRVLRPLFATGRGTQLRLRPRASNRACRRLPLDGRDLTPGAALIASKTLSRVADLLAKVIQSDHGHDCLNAFIIRLVSLLDSKMIGTLVGCFRLPSRTIEEDLRILLGEPAQWESSGLSFRNLTDALRQLAVLLTLGNKQAEGVEVVSSGDTEIRGLWRGREIFLNLDKDAGDSLWGKLSSYRIRLGPNELLGMRLVAQQRQRCPQSEAKIPLATGDVIQLAAPDRAAYLTIVAFDRQPDLGKAADFEKELAALHRVEDRIQLRVRRLSGMPVVQEFMRLAEADEAWRLILPALEPHVTSLYKAAAQAGGRFEGVSVSVGIRQIAGSLALATAACLASSEALRQQEIESTQQLPIYTMQRERLE